MEFVTLEELIDMLSEQSDQAIERKLQMYKTIREERLKELEEARKDAGIGPDTAGTLF